MRKGSRIASASCLALLAAAWIVTACGGPAVARELEVTYYYLPG